MQKVLILGAKGMLGQALVAVFENDKSYEVHAWDKEECDVTNGDLLRQKISALWPDIIYNTVAYNNVDLCEVEEVEHQKAKEMNVTLPHNLAKIAHSLNIVLVHYSTDYVFDGQRPRYKFGKNAQCCGAGCSGCMYKGAEETISYFAYHEDDETQPISVYGTTKRDGENEVIKNATAYYVIRLSKLFGEPARSSVGKKSFFDIMTTLGDCQKEVRVVDGEISKFTYAPDLAQKSKDIVEANKEYGIYHVANEGAVSWYEGVKELYQIIGCKTPIIPISSSELNRSAKRPDSSALKVTKIEKLRHYTDALQEYYTHKQKEK